MTIKNIFASLCAAAVVFCIAIAPAYAQATRSWVSGVGNDGNTCTRTSPCLTFARALTQTVAGGEIDCLDSGGFGTVNIGKSVTINCEGAIGGVQAGGGAVGINVNVTQSDVVYLRGLDIQGTTNGASGISVVQAGVLHVEHCLIHNFHFGAASGIVVAATGQSRLFVSNSFITDNGNGILIRPTGSGIVNAVVKQVHLETNGVGLGVDGTASTGKVTLSLVDSVAAGNGSGNWRRGRHQRRQGNRQCHDQPGEPVGQPRGPARHGAEGDRPDRQFRHLRQCDRRRRRQWRDPAVLRQQSAERQQQ